MRGIAAALFLCYIAWPQAASAQGLQVRIQPDRLTCSPGAQCATNAYATGGQEPITYTWYVGNEATGVVNQSKVWTFNTPGHYTLRVVARDRNGRTGEGRAQVDVNPAQVRIERRGTLHFSATPEGLTPPFQFRIYQDGTQLGNPIPTYNRSLEFSVNTGHPGTHQVKVLVIDANGLEIWGSANYDENGGFTGGPPPPPPSGGSGFGPPPPPPPPPPPGDDIPDL